MQFCSCCDTKEQSSIIPSPKTRLDSSSVGEVGNQQLVSRLLQKAGRLFLVQSEASFGRRRLRRDRNLEKVATNDWWHKQKHESEMKKKNGAAEWFVFQVHPGSDESLFFNNVEGNTASCLRGHFTGQRSRRKTRFLSEMRSVRGRMGGAEERPGRLMMFS